ncbi:MAG: O-antigen translocase [Bryobacteraceae bacterium]
MSASASTAEPSDATPIRQTEDGPRAQGNSYGQILKSSALIGGSSVLNIGVGIVRTKLMAVLLGPTGVGLAGLYGSIADLTENIAGMGINSSGIRQIAEAASSRDAGRIARTALVLRRISMLLGLLGAISLVLFSRPISLLTFGTSQHATAVAVLSLAVLLRLVSAGQKALVQGMRRISDLAKMGVLGAVSGTLITIPVIYFLRERGIVLSLVGVAMASILTSWWYSRKIHIEPCRITGSQIGHESRALLNLGVALMASILLTMGAGYLIRVTLTRKLGIEATGLYQSAWTLGGIYVGFILQAMGTDFYPRLTASSNDNVACNRMVNEQTQVGIVLASPGVIATLTFTPLIMAAFYDSRFAAAVPILRWICLGTMLQVLTWPMGFITLAKAKQSLFLFTDVAWTLVYIALTWICVRLYGLNGAGMAFFASYIFHAAVTYPVARHLSGFRWSVENKKTAAFFLSLIAFVFCGFHVLSSLSATLVGIAATILSASRSIRILLQLVPVDRTPFAVRGLRFRLGGAVGRRR